MKVESNKIIIYLIKLIIFMKIIKLILFNLY